MDAKVSTKAMTFQNLNKNCPYDVPKDIQNQSLTLYKLKQRHSHSLSLSLVDFYITLTLL